MLFQENINILSKIVQIKTPMTLTRKIQKNNVNWHYVNSIKVDFFQSDMLFNLG
jgi:hypothetical protein